LIVDDEDFIREMLACLLEQHGFAVLQAADGREAVDQCRRQHPAIVAVLLDVNLPDQNGARVLAALREINPSLRCCFMTGASDLSIVNWQEQGADRLFFKPFPLDEMVAVLRELTGALQLAG
jgi:DNA-binding response OmpR family regulator